MFLIRSISMRYFFFTLMIMSIWASTVVAGPKRMIVPELTDIFLPPGMSSERPIGNDVLRVEIDWKENEKYSLAGLYHEQTGTAALVKASQSLDPVGSFKAQLIVNGSKIFYSSLGSKKVYGQLVRTLSFRFPLVKDVTSLRLIVLTENLKSGRTEKILDQELSLQDVKQTPESLEMGFFKSSETI